MARLKTAYREKPAAAEINSAEPTIPGEYLPDEDQLQREAITTPAEPQPQPEPPKAPQPQEQVEPQGDAATDALRVHMANVQRAEAIQAQRQAMADGENRRVGQNTPAAQANYAALGPLHHQAMQMGLADLSPEYFAHMEQGLEALEPVPEQPAEVQPMPEPILVEPPERIVQETPKFFQPPPAPRMAAPRSVMVSAPVSRTIPYAGDRDHIVTDPKHIRLSPAQREAARISGVSERTYAEGLIAIEREKREGRRS